MQQLKSVKEAIRQPYAFPGGYPLHLITKDGACLCVECARVNFYNIVYSALRDINDGWLVAGVSINWEDTDLICDNCAEPIQSAYGE